MVQLSSGVFVELPQCMEQFDENNKVYLFTKCNSQTTKSRNERVREKRSAKQHVLTTYTRTQTMAQNAWKTSCNFLKWSQMYGVSVALLILM